MTYSNSKKYISISNIIFMLLSISCLLRFKVIAASHAWVFLFFFLCFFILALSFFYKILYSFAILFQLLLLFSLIFFIASNNIIKGGIFDYIIKFLFPFIYYYTTVLIINQLSTRDIIKSIKKIVPIFIVYLTVEAGIRYLIAYKNVSAGNFLLFFGYFKIESIAYRDTNFLALVILYIICLTIFLEEYTKSTLWFKYFLVLFIFSILTLSRSVIVTGILLLYLRHFFGLLKKKQYIFSLFEILIVIIILWYVFLLFFEDASFRSKITIVKSMKNIFIYDIENVLFGFGFGSESETAYAYYIPGQVGYGHLHIALLTGEYGLLGVLLFIIFFVCLLFKTKGSYFYLFFSFIVSGFSLMFFDSSLFWVSGIITVLSSRKKYENMLCY